MPTTLPKFTVSIPRPLPETLVLKGGGSKAIAYAGAYRVLYEHEKGFIKNIKRTAGSSAGAMTALMIALGYTPDEIDSELNKDFSEFKDHEPSRFGVIGRTINGIRNLLGKKRGYYAGKKLHAWIQSLIEKKLGDKDATFNTLHEKAREKNSDFKDLYVTATNANKQITEVFSHENEDFANVPIAQAVLASMSIPLFFQAPVINGEQYFDGGVLKNYPITPFDERKYWPPGYFSLLQGEVINPSVLGLRVDSEEEKNALWGKPNNPIITFFAWLKNLFNTVLSDNNVTNQYTMVTISIDNCGIGTTQFDLSTNEKDKLKEEGKESVSRYIEQEINGAAYELLTYDTLESLEKDYETKQKIMHHLQGLRTPDENDTELLATLALECEAMKQTLEKHKEIPPISPDLLFKPKPHCCNGHHDHERKKFIFTRLLLNLALKSKSYKKLMAIRGEAFIGHIPHSEDCKGLQKPNSTIAAIAGNSTSAPAVAAEIPREDEEDNKDVSTSRLRC